MTDSFVQDLLYRLGCIQIAETGEGLEAKCGFGDCPGKRRCFRVNTTDKFGRWICHGCDRRGGLSELVRHALGVDPLEAARIARERLVDRVATRLRPQKQDQTEELGVKNIAPYRRCLSAYLVGRGYEPDDIWLYRFGFDERKREIVAPTYDVRGKLVGISRRRDEPRAPFIHRPFPKKSEHVFALDIAVASGKKSVVVTEGQLDPLGLRPYWEDPIVATMGAHMSRAQAQLLVRYFPFIILAYDNDVTGMKGTMHALKLIRDLGSTKIQILTYNGKDPGDLPKQETPGFELLSPIKWVQRTQEQYKGQIK